MSTMLVGMVGMVGMVLGQSERAELPEPSSHVTAAYWVRIAADSEMWSGPEPMLDGGPLWREGAVDAPGLPGYGNSEAVCHSCLDGPEHNHVICIRLLRRADLDRDGRQALQLYAAIQSDDRPVGATEADSHLMLNLPGWLWDCYSPAITVQGRWLWVVVQLDGPSVRLFANGRKVLDVQSTRNDQAASWNYGLIYRFTNHSWPGEMSIDVRPIGVWPDNRRVRRPASKPAD